MTKLKKIIIAVVLICCVPLTYFFIHEYKKHMYPAVTKHQGQLLSVDYWETKQGIPVYFTATPQLPMLDVRVIFRAGSAQSAERAGLAQLTNTLMFTGVKGLDNDALSEALDGLGIQTYQTTELDFSSIGIRSLTERNLLEQGIKLLSSVLSEPQFSQKDFDREQQRQLDSIEYLSQRPEALAELAFYKALYDTHPYAYPAIGTKESVKALTKQDIETFYKQYYVRPNAAIVLVGELSLEEAQQWAETLAEVILDGQAAPALAAPIAPRLAIAKHIEFPSEQTHVRIGQLGMTREQPNYAALYMGNFLLGGSDLVSLLFKNVRGQRGLVYGISSYFLPLAQKGPFIVQLQTRNAQAQNAQDVVRQTLQTFLQTPVTVQQLDEAKKDLMGNFPLRLMNNAAISEQLTTFAVYHLPLDYLDVLLEKITKLTPQEIQQAFAEQLHMDNLISVSVGASQKIAVDAKQ